MAQTLAPSITSIIHATIAPWGGKDSQHGAVPPQRTHDTAMQFLAMLESEELRDAPIATLDAIPPMLYQAQVFGWRPRARLERRPIESTGALMGWNVWQRASCRPGQPCLGGVSGWAGMAALLTAARLQGAKTLGEAVAMVRAANGSPFALVITPEAATDAPAQDITIVEPVAMWCDGANPAPYVHDASKAGTITRATLHLPAKRERKARKVA